MDDRDDVAGPLGVGSGDPSRPFAVGGEGGAPQQPTYSESPPRIPDEDPEGPYEPLEPLNPWISIVTRPRDTIRYVLETGEWSNWILVYTIAYVLTIPSAIVSTFASPNSSRSFAEFDLGVALPVVMLVVVIFVMAIVYPLALLFTYVMGWLYNVVGRWDNGVGTASEMRTSIVWGGVIGVYVGLVGMIPNGIAALYYRTTDEPSAVVIIIIGILTSLIILPMWVYSVIVYCKVIGEAHRFSAWQGYGVMFTSGVIVFVTIALPFVALVGALVAFGMTVQ